MSCAVVSIIVGVPLTEEAGAKISEWEEAGDERWTDTRDGQCGFTTRYSASGQAPIGYCGVLLCDLESYQPQNLEDVKLEATKAQIEVAMKKVEKLDPELKKLAGKFGLYFIWSDT